MTNAAIATAPTETVWFEVSAAWMTACGYGDVATAFTVIRSYERGGMCFVDVDGPRGEWTVNAEWRGRFVNPPAAPNADPLYNAAVYYGVAPEAAVITHEQPAITVAQAVAYTVDHFASSDYAMNPVHVVSTAPNPDCPDAIDVKLWEEGKAGRGIMTCWLDEHGKPYGEW